MSDRPSAIHIPVLLREVLRALALAPGLIVVDGTVGAGGHSRKIVEQIGATGLLLGLDRDAMMLNHAATVLPATERVQLVHDSYVNLPSVLAERGLSEGVDRILLDLGLSSDQLADAGRGFGFQSNGPLDLRFDTRQGLPARELLATSSVADVERWLREYGEEHHSARIAQELVARATAGRLQTGADLADAVQHCVGPKSAGGKHPATRVFQALRIAVNHELEHVQRGLEQSVFESLRPGGLAAVISFHSLEDRIVKQEFRRADRWENLTPHPIVATPQEERINPRSRSAKLRVARKCASTDTTNPTPTVRNERIPDASRA